MARILIIDDSTMARALLSNLLINDNHTVIGQASDGEEGLTLYKELRPDIVTLDIAMPKSDGIQTLKNIINYDPNAIVFMTTSIGDVKNIFTALQCGASEYIKKPYEPSEILSLIKKYAN